MRAWQSRCPCATRGSRAGEYAGSGGTAAVAQWPHHADQAITDNAASAEFTVVSSYGAGEERTGCGHSADPLAPLQVRANCESPEPAGVRLAIEYGSQHARQSVFSQRQLATAAWQQRGRLPAGQCDESSQALRAWQRSLWRNTAAATRAKELDRRGRAVFSSLLPVLY